MLRNLFVFALLLAAMTIAVVFAALNQGTVDVDLAFFSFTLQKSLAFILAFGVGVVFGMLCVAGWVLGLVSQRRRLQKSLRLAEGEVKSLREIPVNDAQ